MKKPKKFKKGKIELWVNFTLNSFRIITDSGGNGIHTIMYDCIKPEWYKNGVCREVLLNSASDKFLGYL